MGIRNNKRKFPQIFFFEKTSSSNGSCPSGVYQYIASF